ncbi:MAG: hypothetical protein MUF83_03280 [Acidimicrobiales bacterium]|jgi:plastocyanin|nr:hypothetical protein [Acidimicrobiales bacterium]
MPRPRVRTTAVLFVAALSLGACSDDETTETADPTGTSAPSVTLPAESGFDHGSAMTAPGGTGATEGLTPDEEMQEWCDTYPGIALSAEAAVVKFTEGAVCPGYITVRLGTPVSFKNLTEAPQTVRVTANDGTTLAASPEMAPGQTWSHTLDEVATYDFYTSALPDLRGAIEVQEPE